MGLNVELKIEPVELRLHSTFWKHANTTWYWIMYYNHKVLWILLRFFSSQCGRREASTGPCSLCASSEAEHVFPAGRCTHSANMAKHTDQRREVSVPLSAPTQTPTTLTETWTSQTASSRSSSPQGDWDWNQDTCTPSLFSQAHSRLWVPWIVTYIWKPSNVCGPFPHTNWGFGCFPIWISSYSPAGQTWSSWAVCTNRFREWPTQKIVRMGLERTYNRLR